MSKISVTSLCIVTPLSTWQRTVDIGSKFYGSKIPSFWNTCWRNLQIERVTMYLLHLMVKIWAGAFSKFFSLRLSRGLTGADWYWLRSQVARTDLKFKPVSGDDLAQTRYSVNAGYRIGHFSIQTHLGQMNIRLSCWIFVFMSTRLLGHPALRILIWKSSISIVIRNVIESH
jgi:hypothetical protein